MVLHLCLSDFYRKFKIGKVHPIVPLDELRRGVGVGPSNSECMHYAIIYGRLTAVVGDSDRLQDTIRV